LQTAALAYTLDSRDADSTVADNVCWWGDTALVPHLFRLLGLQGLRASLHFGPVVTGADRFVLSENAHAAVSSMYANLIADSTYATEPAGITQRHQSGVVQAL
jgi:1-acyl-sn-glycerol-3-phosphate acyltransferase